MERPDSEFTVSVSRVLPAKRWKVLRLITRIQDYHRYLPNILECKVLSREPGRVVTSWLVEMEKIPISWKEEEYIDLQQFAIHFKALEGDLEKFEGSWKLLEHMSGGTEVSVQATIKIGIPVFERIVGGMIAEKVRKNFESMLAAFDNVLTHKRYQKISDHKVRDVHGFAVIGHPYNYQHLVSNLNLLKPGFKAPSPEFLAKVFDLTPSYPSAELQEIRSPHGETTRGTFISCNIIPEMLAMDLEKVVRKVVDACKVAERLGLGVVALGGFTSIAGERYGEEFRKKIHIPVTTGNTLTAALAIEGVLKAARLMELDLSKCKATVIGGAGDIGGACALTLAGLVKEVMITSRSKNGLKKMEKAVKAVKRAKFRGGHDNNKAVQGADIVIAAASASQSIVDAAHFKPGAIICDVGFPKNIAYADTGRDDILVFAGGLCRLPSPFRTGFEIGLPSPEVLYGCFSEAIVLALEKRYESFSWGRGNITPEKMSEIHSLAKKHGFTLAPFFWAKGLVTDEDVREIQARAHQHA